MDDTALISWCRHYAAERAALQNIWLMANGDEQRMTLQVRRDMKRRQAANKALYEQIVDTAPTTLVGLAAKAAVFEEELQHYADLSPTVDDYPLWRFCRDAMAMAQVTA